MKDATSLLSKLRHLRKKAENLNATLLRDLRPFLGTELFRRLPNSNQVGNATTTCSCLMAIADSDQPLKLFRDLFKEADKEVPDDDVVKRRVTSMFKNIVSGPWTSSGLLDGNAFSSLLILRTSGLLLQSRGALLTDSPLSMNHTFKPDPDQKEEVAEPFAVGQTKTLKEILQSLSENPPVWFSVDEYPPTSAIAYWFVDAAEKLEVSFPKDKWEDLVAWASKNFTRQVSLDTSSHDAMKDPVEMAMAACLSQQLKRVVANQDLEFSDKLKATVPSDIELQDAVLRSFVSQQESGIWPKYFPLFNYRKGGAGSNYLFSFELLEVIVEEFGKTALIESTAVLQGIERALSWCESNRLTHKYKRTNYQGWNSGGQLWSLSQGKPESWATAMVHLFLHKLRSALSGRIDRHVLLKYGVVPDVVDKDTEPWKDFIDSPVKLPSETIGVKDLIQRELLKDIESHSFSANNKFLGRRSALLFGPPGTSKTSLVRATAKKIGWPLVELNPSHFLRLGLENVYSQAEQIFDDLNDLSSAVVFFDEMDALTSEREQAGLDVTRQLLTTSMLPKLSKLYGEARVLFFMATNHQKDFDAAIKRPGRFDLLICMRPPLFDDKLNKLSKFLPRQEPADIEFVRQRLIRWVASHGDLAKNFDDFTFDEFRNFLEQIGKRATTLRDAFEEMSEEEFVTVVNEWGSSYIALSRKEAKEEFENDKQASRTQ